LPGQNYRSQDMRKINGVTIAIFLIFHCVVLTQAAEVTKHIAFFSSLPDRLPGTASSLRAADYIEQALKNIGLANVKRETFTTVIPVDKGSWLKSGNATIPLYPFWPNSVRTCTTGEAGITGNMLYCGKEGIRSLAGKDISGSVVVMEFNSGSTWLDLAGLGARAFIFLESDSMNRVEAERKFVSVPLDVPRFFVRKEHVAEIRKLAAKEQQVTVSSRVDWEAVPSYNIYGTIEGRDPNLKKELVIISAYYDSMSVVPTISPGAEQSCGISAMLELASYFKANPPKRSVMFLATSSHCESLKGIDDFVQKHLRTNKDVLKTLKEPIKTKFFIGLDLSSQSDQIGVWHNFYDFNYQRILSPFGKKLIEYAQQVSRNYGYDPDRTLVNGISPEKGVVWRNYLPEIIRTDGEMAILAGIPAISFITVNDARGCIDTPCDTFSRINTNNIEKQLTVLKGVIERVLSDPDFFLVPDLNIQDKMARLVCHVVTFNPRKSFVPSEPVKGAVVLPRYQYFYNVSGGPMCAYQKTYLGVRGDLIEMTNNNGEAAISRIPLSISFLLQAYGFDQNSGKITLAPDFGINGDEQYPNRVGLDTYDKKWMLVLFECKPINLIGLVDPQYLIPASKLDVFDLSNSLPEAYSYFLETYDAPQWKWSSYSEPVGVVFARPHTVIKIAGESGPLGIRSLLLNNKETITNKEVAEGAGFDVDAVDAIDNVSYQAARDMINLDSYRTYNFKKYNIRNERLDALETQSKELLQTAESAKKEKDWWGFLKFSRQAQAIESRAYPDVKGTANDVVKGVIFYFMLLLPFAYFGERLFMGFPKLEKRIAGIFGIFLVIYFIIRLVHPAFKLTRAPEVILLAFIVLALSFVVISIVTSKFEEQMQRMKRESSKVYQTDVGRVTAAGTAFSLGVANMKRRKVRTILTGTTLVLLTFTVLSFTSIKSFLKFNQILRSNTPSYHGILLRDRSWNPLQEIANDYVVADFEGNGTIAPRYWYIIEDLANKTALDVQTEQKGYYAAGLLGMTPEEKVVTGVDKCLVAGSWFGPDDYESIILPDKIAEKLGIGASDVGLRTVKIYGRSLVVKGIYDSAKFSKIRDLDDEPLTPVNFANLPSKELDKLKMEKTAQVFASAKKLESFIHIEPENVPIVPASFIKEFKGTLQSVAVKFNPGVNAKELVENFISKLAVILFVGTENKVYVYSSIGLTSLSGLSNLIIPILIAAMIVLNTMLGSVYERLREIGTYSAVGLAPVHIASLFLAESGVFAVMGAVAGYLLGQILTKFLIVTGLLKGLILNYSSLSAVFATIIIIITVLLSTLYPARKASQMAVPDVTRRWVLPDPKGDEWDFEFPFTVSEIEVLGLATFLTEYFSSYQDVSLGNFYTGGAELVREPLAGGKDRYVISTTVSLAPFDLGVSQTLRIEMQPLGQFNFYTINLVIRRASGESTDWKRLNRRFLDGIRKQFLIWRTVSIAIKKEYEQQGRAVLKIT